MLSYRRWVPIALVMAIAMLFAGACSEDSSSTITPSPTTSPTTAPSSTSTTSPTANPSTTATPSSSATETAVPTDTPTETATEPSGELADDQVLRMVVPGEPDILDPTRSEFANDIAVIHNIFRGAFFYDEALALTPDMAAEIPTVENGGISADGLTYTIKLRDGLKWSDGQPLTAADFVYTIRRACSPDVASFYRDFFDLIVGCDEYQNAKGTEEAPLTPTDEELAALADAVGVTAPDETTVVITLKQQQPTFLNVMALHSAYPVRHDVVEADPEGWTEPGKIVGSGPFILTSWNHNQDMTFEQNPNWWGEPFTLQRMEWRIIEDETVEYAAYLNDELDWSAIPIETVDLVREDPELSQQNMTANELTVFALSSTTPRRRSITSTCGKRSRPPTTARHTSKRCVGVSAPPLMAGFRPECPATTTRSAKSTR